MNLSDASRSILTESRRTAILRRQIFCGCEQVLETLLVRREAADAARPVTEYLDTKPALPFVPPDAEYTRTFDAKILPAAEASACAANNESIEPDHLLAALLGESSPIPQLLREKVTQRLAKNPSAPRSNGTNRPTLIRSTDEPTKQVPPSTGLARPVAPATDDDGLVDRPGLIDQLMLTLLFSNPLLVGPVGSGRRSLLRLAARALRDGKRPDALSNVTLLELDPLQLVAGTSYRGELEERVQQLLRELLDRDDRPVLVLTNPQQLLDTNRSGGSGDFAAALVPHLRSGELKLIACATQDVLREHIEKHPALLDCLTLVPVPVVDAREARRLLEGMPSRLSERFGVQFEPQALDAAIHLCARYVPHQALLGAAEKLLQGAAATLAYESSMRARDPERSSSHYWFLMQHAETSTDAPAHLGERHLMHALSQQQRIPFEHLESNASERLRSLSDALRSKIFGQDHVLDLLETRVKVVLENLADRSRPRGRLLFLGPPGTGKSECARLLARHLMGSEQAFLRFDMSEFQERSAVSTLIGSDKGLVGSEEGGRLTEPMRENPHRVLLFDEIEKAHPSIFNLFLQILEYGEIHDKRGRVVSFRHAICIFTSNAGCGYDQGLYGLTRDEIVERLKNVFRSELFDRIEDLVPFQALDAAARRKVVALRLQELQLELQANHRLALEWDDAVVEAGSVAPRGEAGVRNVLRWISHHVKPAIANALLGNVMGRQDGSRVRLSMIDGRLAAALLDGAALDSTSVESEA